MGKNKTTEELQLNSILLAFHHVKGTHDGERLARIALNITNQARVTEIYEYHSPLQYLLLTIHLDGPLDDGWCLVKYHDDAGNASTSQPPPD